MAKYAESLEDFANRIGAVLGMSRKPAGPKVSEIYFRIWAELEKFGFDPYSSDKAMWDMRQEVRELSHKLVDMWKDG